MFEGDIVKDLMGLKFRSGDIKIVFGFLGSLLILSLFLFHLLRPLELLSYDFFQKIKPEQQSHPQIVLIEVAEDGIKAFGRWPWARKYHAAIVSILNQLEVKQVVYDILFTESSPPEEDNLFEIALKQNPIVYLPYAFEAFEENGVIRYATQYQPVKQFRDWLKGMGHINIESGDDGVIRQFSLIIEKRGQLYPSISFQACLDQWGVLFEDLIIKKGKWIEVPMEERGNIIIPIDNRYRIWINWVGRWKNTFKHYSFLEIIQAFKQKQMGEEPMIDLNELKGKVAIIGLTALGLSDIKIIPLQPVYPGVGVHANIIQNLLTQKFIYPVSQAWNAVIILVLSLFASMAIFRKKTGTSIVLVLSTIVLYLLGSFVLLVFYGVWIAILSPVLAVLLNFISATLYSEIHLAVEKKRLEKLATRDGLTGLFNRRHFELFLDAEFKKQKSKPDKIFSVVMTDIDHFKGFNDTYGHQTGDLVLREVAKTFRLSVRELDIVGRYGGEEFIVLLPGTGIDEAMIIAERMRKNTELHKIKDGNTSHTVMISAGVACIAGDASTAELIKRADDALYVAKETGRNKVLAAKEPQGSVGEEGIEDNK